MSNISGTGGPGDKPPIQRPSDEVKTPKEAKVTSSGIAGDTGKVSRKKGDRHAAEDDGTKLRDESGKPDISDPKKTYTRDQVTTALDHAKDNMASSIPIDVESLLALKDMVDALNLPAKFTKEELEAMSIVLGQMSPEQISDFAYKALQGLAFDAEGNLTNEFKEFIDKGDKSDAFKYLKNEVMDKLKEGKIPGGPGGPGGPDGPPPPKEAYSMYTLMILLMEISRQERDTLQVGAREDQLVINAKFEEKKSTMVNQAITNLTLSLGTTIAGAAIKIGGSKLMAKRIDAQRAKDGLAKMDSRELMANQNRWFEYGGMLEKFGNTAQQAVDSLKFKTELTGIEAEMSKLRFSQDQLKGFKDANKQLMDSLERTKNTMFEEIERTKKGIAGKV